MLPILVPLVGVVWVVVLCCVVWWCAVSDWLGFIVCWCWFLVSLFALGFPLFVLLALSLLVISASTFFLQGKEGAGGEIAETKA